MLRTTAIMKTDIRDSTERFRRLSEQDLEAALAEHRQLISRLAQAHDGRVVKPEGDGFWMVFPSVTAAARAAMSMQEELRLAQPGKGDARLAMRIVIVVGDVLHQEGGLVGDAVVLATRIESITPPDEIYLSPSAWLAMNQAEVRAAFVDTFALKGFPEPVAVYRIEQTHRMRVIADQCIVVTDLRGFAAIAEGFPLSVVEKLLDSLLELVGRVCAEFSGSHRSQTGDSYLLTFPDAARAMAAVERLADGWSAFRRREGLRCTMNVGVHKGDLYAFRSYLLSRDANLAFNLESATSRLEAEDESIFLTGLVRKDLAGTPWDGRLQPVDIRPSPPRLAGIEVYRLGRTEPDSRGRPPAGAALGAPNHESSAPGG
jgi:class 3 adenylate cyclase